ncbi:hypothetical protein CRE_07145 [Caenorhabditis remanei]|uniref:Uncharacterized protein n=1 Tax=Caenorhabditis remanei TaxID=31234 RepID=E3NR78_CAERE|nr:hypothetical protein CRE_07145 [Caenorhabditis remanei]
MKDFMRDYENEIIPQEKFSRDHGSQKGLQFLRVANDLPNAGEQPEQLEAAQEEPMEEDDDIAPMQNKDQQDNMENNEEMDAEEAEVQPAGGLRRNAPKKKPVSLMKLRHEKKNIRFHSLRKSTKSQRRTSAV